MDADETGRTNDIIRGIERMRGAPCRACSRPICGHEAVVGIAMGYGGAPHCLPCMAGALNCDRETLRDRVREYVFGRECYRTGWLRASEQEGFGESPAPGCLWPNGDGQLSGSSRARRPEVDERARRRIAVEWDAGDLGCGDLVMELRIRLNAMRPGELLKLTARDPGAREDVPAWCRLTGHDLVEGVHPTYLIRRKGE